MGEAPADAGRSIQPTGIANRRHKALAYRHMLTVLEDQHRFPPLPLDHLYGITGDPIRTVNLHAVRPVQFGERVLQAEQNQVAARCGVNPQVVVFGPER